MGSVCRSSAALVVERYGGKINIKNRVEGDYAKGPKIELWLPKA